MSLQGNASQPTMEISRPTVLRAHKTMADSQVSGIRTALYRIDPLKDARWDELLKRHPDASVFHSTEWLEALRRTYGYESIAFTTSPPDERMENGFVFCRVESWLTGRRLVSLPFSDYCEPLVQEKEDLQVFISALEEESGRGYWRYVEIRPRQAVETASPLCHEIAEYTFHQLDLEPSLDVLFRNLHKDSTQRKILRAKREGLTYEEGPAESSLDTFYQLLTITRRRHQVPPQPRTWFRNLIASFGSGLQIRIAYKGRQPVAGMLTLRYKDTLYYKYGGSDVRFNNLGGMHMLYWEAIQRAKDSGLRLFDLGRSDADQAGLITFKRRWGATQSRLVYLRFAPSANHVHAFEPARETWRTRLAKQVFARAPVSVLPILGKAFYKHIG
jgi:CelD/BcsL family acetyltransferase involved in cellulose biosynthesis